MHRCPTISLHAGGGWSGHTFFKVDLIDFQGNEISDYSHFNTLQEVKNYCLQYGYDIDIEEVRKILKNFLISDPKNEDIWLVEKDKLEPHREITSCQKYLTKVNAELEEQSPYFSKLIEN